MGCSLDYVARSGGYAGEDTSDLFAEVTPDLVGKYHFHFGIRAVEGIDISEYIHQIQTGTKLSVKDWYLHPTLGKCLFKEAASTQAIISDARTDWTEKVVNEIANLLSLPVARYELATGYFGRATKLVEGVVSINCIPDNAQILTGEEFLTQVLDSNLDDPRQYTVKNVLQHFPAIWSTQTLLKD